MHSRRRQQLRRGCCVNYSTLFIHIAAHIPSTDTAILLFSREAGEEAAHKGWTASLSKKGGRQLAAALIKRTVHEARQTGLPVLTFFSEKQKGASFGERLCNAIEEAFAAGYGRLLVCGTDTPGLGAAQLSAAASALTTQSLVLGPSTDGGVYLIGLTTGAYCRDAFLRIAWKTPCVFEQLQAYAKVQSLSLSIEAKADDLDDAEALFCWQAVHRQHWLCAVLSHLIACFCQKRYLVFRTDFSSCFRQNLLGLRGPPTCFG